MLREALMQHMKQLWANHHSCFIKVSLVDHPVLETKGKQSSTSTKAEKGEALDSPEPDHQTKQHPLRRRNLKVNRYHTWQNLGEMPHRPWWGQNKTSGIINPRQSRPDQTEHVRRRIWKPFASSSATRNVEPAKPQIERPRSLSLTS